MADTIRKQILDSLVTHVEGEDWVIAGGIGINPGKQRYKKAEIPGMSVFAGNEEGSKNKYGNQDCMVSVELKYIGLLSSTPDAAFDISEEIRGQMINSVMNATLGGLADQLEYAGGTIDYPEAEEETLQVSIMINIYYETLLKNPYSQGD